MGGSGCVVCGCVPWKRLQNATTLCSLPSSVCCCLISWQFSIFLKSGIFRAQQFTHRLCFHILYCPGSRFFLWIFRFSWSWRNLSHVFIIDITKYAPSNIGCAPLLRPHCLNANLLNNEEPKQMEEKMLSARPHLVMWDIENNAKHTSNYKEYSEYCKIYNAKMTTREKLIIVDK